MAKQIIPTITFDDDKLHIIDQRLLPAEEIMLDLTTPEEVYQAIKTLAVRGAPAIGVVAAYGVYVCAKALPSSQNIGDFKKNIFDIIKYLSESRPTAYNLFYALDKAKEVVESRDTQESILSSLKSAAVQFHADDLEKSERIGENGLTVVPKGARILTHCNAGGLATGGNGTALAVMFAAHQAGKEINVWVDETRPLLQGARLTAWELKRQAIPYRVICDNMSAMVMAKGEVDMVVLGADRIAANGDFANKIGTYGVAVLAKYHGIPFYTAAPLTTFDLNIKSGAEIPIEERDGNEICRFAGKQTAPADSPSFNPAFDVTPHSLLTGIITEYGVIYPPFKENIEKMIGKNYG